MAPKIKPAPMPFYEVEVVRCVNHRQTLAIVIGGFRVVGSKCCGQWITAARWMTSVGDFLEAMNQAVPTRPKRARAPKARR